jgi:hypothetical protein
MSDKVEAQGLPGAYSTQFNVVTTVDVAGVLAGKSAAECIWMTDNSLDSTGKGSAALETVCRRGQVLNWLVYSLDSERRPDGSYPPIARILNIAFLRGDTDFLAAYGAGFDVKVFGAPDRIRSPYTPVYAYWAGMVPVNADLGRTRYRMTLEIAGSAGGRPTYVELSQPSITVSG